MHTEAKRLTGKDLASKMFSFPMNAHNCLKAPYSLQMSMPPKIRKHSVRGIAAAVCLLVMFQQGTAQPANGPETQELLNGLKILFWPKPGSTEVLVKLRIHGGSAFDLAGRAGQMALLGDILFPDPETTDYFTEQMGGKLDVVVNYDSITITMVGKADQLNNILEVLRNAILATQLTPEVVKRVRETRIKMVRDTAVSPATMADRAITARLFGSFPYGRPSGGSNEDLGRVDRADLMLARDRFLNPNNATLAILGGITQGRAMRTLKQLLGPWRKSEQIVPSSFTAAKAPDSRTLIVNAPSPTAEVRLALRGIARSDPDFHTALVLARVAQNRWQELNPELASKPTFARSESYALPGIFSMGTAVNAQSTPAAIVSARKVLDSLMTSQVPTTELERAKREVLSETDSERTKIEAQPDPWLDMDTYRLPTPQDRATLVQAISAADIQRVATRLFKDAPLASVVVGDPLQLKAALQGQLQFEVLGEGLEPTPSSKPPTKPGIVNNPG